VHQLSWRVWATGETARKIFSKLDVTSRGELIRLGLPEF
jgi:hypothetical protein